MKVDPCVMDRDRASCPSCLLSSTVVKAVVSWNVLVCLLVDALSNTVNKDLHLIDKIYRYGLCSLISRIELHHFHKITVES